MEYETILNWDDGDKILDILENDTTDENFKHKHRENMREKR